MDITPIEPGQPRDLADPTARVAGLLAQPVRHWSETPEDAQDPPDDEPPDDEPPDDEPPDDEPPDDEPSDDEPPDDEPPDDEPPSSDGEAEDPGRITRISDDLRARMESTTWQPGCPVAIDDLRELTVRYVGFDDVEHEGRLIVHVDVAEGVLEVFDQLFEDRFPIERIEPVEHFDGDDDASMAANNTSAFNCRPITGSGRWSEHSYGTAVDINPIQNPYVRDGVVLPPEGEAYLDRADVRPGMVTRPGVVDQFDQLGWGWGGDWNSLVDYMHFSVSGR